jgi:WD40 repeat protein/energy-coupling factor transporter ATP-binding protein EcfA2
MDYFMTDFPISDYQQIQSFGNITIDGKNNVFTINQVIQISASAIYSRQFKPTSPYKGLKKFNSGDKSIFFGRDQLIQDLLIAVQKNKVSLILGASGSGKSSVIRAGLIPKLKELIGESFCDFIFTPGKDPFESFYRSLTSEEKDNSFSSSQSDIALERKADTLSKTVEALKDEKSQWFIFIDQFEEIFTNCSSLEAKNNFIESITRLAQDANDSVRIILAMRADFLDQFGIYSKFSELFQNNFRLVTDMHSDQLRQAIEQPAARNGVVFEEGLVEEIIDDLQGQAGYLPLLQYTLNLVWESECKSKSIEDRTINVESYRMIGGVRGALQLRVDTIYKNFSQDEQKATKQIFLRLVNIFSQNSGKAERVVARKADRSEFVGVLIENTLNKLINENLLVSRSQNDTEQSIIEVSHEILLSSWETLVNWINDAKEVIIIANRLSDDAMRWESALKKNDLINDNIRIANDELWTGSRLERVLELQEQNIFELVLGDFNLRDKQFIVASADERKSRIVEEENRRKRELDQEIKARKLAQTRNRIATISLLVLTGLSIFAVNRYMDAQVKTIEALSASSKALFSSEPGLDSLIEALRAGASLRKTFWAGVETRAQVLTALQQTVFRVKEYNRLEGHDSHVWSAVPSPNGQIIASAGGDNNVILWRADGSVIKKLQGHQSQVYSVAFSPDSTLLATGSADQTVKLWRSDGTLLKSFQGKQGHKGEVKSVSFSPNGNIIASAGDDQTIKLWHLDGRLIHTTDKLNTVVRCVSFNRDGILASASFDHIVRLWKPDGSLLRTLKGHTMPVNGVSFSPDGKTIASASDDRTVKLWKVDGTLIRTLSGFKGIVWDANFSSDGKKLATADHEPNIKIWQLDEKEKEPITLRSRGAPIYSTKFLKQNGTTNLISSSFDRNITLWHVADTSSNAHKILEGHTDRIWRIHSDYHGIYFASAAGDNTFRLWKAVSDKAGEAGELLRTFSGHTNSVTNISFSHDSELIASSSLDTTVKLWRSKTGNLIHTLKGHTNWVWGVSISPDGKTIASTGNDKTIRFWNSKGHLIKVINKAHNDWIFDINFSPDGQTLASSSRDKTIRLWSIDGRLIRTFSGHNDLVASVIFSPDGKFLASASGDKTVKLWKISDGSLIKTFPGHKAYVLAVSLSKDGQTIASASWDHTVKIWKIDGRLITTLQGHSDEVNGVAFSPDAKWLASASKDKTVILWDLKSPHSLSLDDLMAKGCNLAYDYLKTNLSIRNKKIYMCN